LHFAEVQLLDTRADLLDIGRLRVADLLVDAARELDREMEPARREEEHRGEEGDGRDDVEHQRMPHERDVAPDSEELHGGSLCN